MSRGGGVGYEGYAELKWNCHMYTNVMCGTKLEEGKGPLCAYIKEESTCRCQCKVPVVGRGLEFPETARSHVSRQA